VEDDLVTCRIHPEITETQRDVALCDYPPLEYFIEGAACLATIEAIKLIYPDFTFQTRVESDGRVVIKDETLNLGE